MQYYTINGNYLIKEGFSENSSVDNSIEEIFKASQEKVVDTLNKHQEDLLKNISLKDNNLGIGIADPSHKFTVRSQSYDDNFNIIGVDSTKGSGITLTNNLNNSSFLILGGSESELGEGNLGFGNIKDKKYQTNMKLTNSGNLGLGANPQYKLHLSNGNNQKTDIGLGNSLEFGNPKITYQPGQNDNISIGYDFGVNDNAKNNNPNVLSINRNGRIGIKTSNPNADLHLKTTELNDSMIGVSSNNKKAGIIFDNTGKHTFEGDNYGSLSMNSKDLVLENGSRNESIILRTGGSDKFTINKLGQITIKNKLNFNVKEFKLANGKWANGGLYSWSHNLGYLPSFVKIFFYFDRDIGGNFYKDSVYEITNVNDSSDWPYQRGTFVTFNTEKVFIRIAPFGPMLLNLTGKSGSYYDIKPTDGSIVIKVYDTN